MKKKISIAIPCYNESENIPELYLEFTELFKNKLSRYDYEILFVDNKSTDNSRELLRDICSKDSHVKAVFNRMNCGANSNPIHSLRESEGDCTVLFYADFQEPIDKIPEMVEAWENGNKVVCMIKNHSKENGIVYFLREIYYKIFSNMSSINQIRQFTGFGLYDKEFVDVVRQIDDPIPFFKGLVAELAPEHFEIYYTQEKRSRGKSSFNFIRYYDAAMLSFTGYTTCGLRIAIFSGFFVAFVSFILAIFFLIRKIVYWDMFDAGSAPILLSMLFIGSVQLIFMGLLGEYIININRRSMNRPIAWVEERLNF